MGSETARNMFGMPRPVSLTIRLLLAYDCLRNLVSPGCSRSAR